MESNISNFAASVWAGAVELPGEGQIPLPPELHANQTAAWVVIVLLYGGAVAAVGWAGWKLLRDREALPAILVVSGVIAANIEPLGDTVGTIMYAADIPWFHYTIMGRSMPAFILVGCMPYVAMGGYYAYRYIERGRSLRDIVLLSAVWVGVPEIIAEMLLHHWGLIVYYGDNPTRIFGIPLYSIVQNTTLLPVYGIVIYFCVRYLRGANLLWLILFIPAVTIGYVVGVSWPAYQAVQSSAPWPVTWFACLVVCVTSLAVTYALLRIPVLRELRERAATEGDADGEFRVTATAS
ncbi:hypothetical protein [Nocardia africana]|uniref:Uncharacterized protein n=1 Tax=Nocardia africana TaxID=134964 RepID=A0A378WZV8_9NOCA|nr:hypothetical protein [Nocardia africana]MCC3312280.1 hypothetical protein [Nocardia africana]SUA46412.1 Uncharacterised protein [Nocardia africana]